MIPILNHPHVRVNLERIGFITIQLLNSMPCIISILRIFITYSINWEFTLFILVYDLVEFIVSLEVFTLFIFSIILKAYSKMQAALIWCTVYHVNDSLRKLRVSISRDTNEYSIVIWKWFLFLNLFFFIYVSIPSSKCESLVPSCGPHLMFNLITSENNNSSHVRHYIYYFVGKIQS